MIHFTRMIDLRSCLALAALLPVCASAHAQQNAAADSSTSRWSFSAAANVYIIPDGDDYVQPTIVLKRGWLHLEARYDYESLATGSLWFGYNIKAGKSVKMEFTPMVSGVFGQIDGVAPGYELVLNWRKLELYSEGEWVFGLHDRHDSFFYAWSELTVTPVDWFRVGIVGERTHAFSGERDIQRGVLLGLMYKRVGVTAHVFNPDTGKPLYVYSAEVEF